VWHAHRWWVLLEADEDHLQRPVDDWMRYRNVHSLAGLVQVEGGLKGADPAGGAFANLVPRAADGPQKRNCKSQ
jgi:hypothetical protein